MAQQLASLLKNGIPHSPRQLTSIRVLSARVIRREQLHAVGQGRYGSVLELRALLGPESPPPPRRLEPPTVRELTEYERNGDVAKQTDISFEERAAILKF